jgi:hypothetical protein
MNIKTFILPPQNLSQFYNTVTAGQVYQMVKTLDWNNDTLTREYLSRFKEIPEEQTVSFIYGQIEKLATDHRYIEQIRQDISKTVREEFVVNSDQYQVFFPDNRRV